MTNEQLKTAENVLIKADPVLGAVITKQALAPRIPRTDYFSSLCRSIVGQQVSVAAASAIYARLETVTHMEPSAVASLSEEQCKTIGLSRQKISYLKDLAQHFVDNPAVYNHLEKQTDEDVITELTEVKGIGTWSAQMFLMFTLGRADVFALDDIALQNAIIKLYGFEQKPTKAEFTSLAEKWKPYRSVASWHLWQSLNNT